MRSSNVIFLQTGQTTEPLSFSFVSTSINRKGYSASILHLWQSKYLHFQSTNQLFGLKISKIGNVEKNPSLHYYTLLYCNLGEYMIKENILKKKEFEKEKNLKKNFFWDFEKIEN